MHNLRLGTTIFVALLAASLPLAAKTLTFDAEKCHVDIPDSWIDMSKPGLKALYASPGQTKSFVVVIDKETTNVSLDNPVFIRGFEAGVMHNGATITNRQRLMLAGVNAYVIDVTLTEPGGIVYARMWFFVANDYIYTLDISQLAAKPYNDDAMGIVNSFAFIGKPVVPKEKTTAQKAGYVVGVSVGVALILFFFRWIPGL